MVSSEEFYGIKTAAIMGFLKELQFFKLEYVLTALGIYSDLLIQILKKFYSTVNNSTVKKIFNGKLEIGFGRL